MRFSDQVRPVPPLDDGVSRVLGLSSPALTYPRSPRGEYLRCFRETLGLTMGSAYRVLDVGLHAYTGLEGGASVFADRVTWALAELSLVVAAGPGWSGELADSWLRFAIPWRPLVRDGVIDTHAFSEASRYVAAAAALQIHTIKRGILYRLAAALTLEAGQGDSAAALAREGLVGDIGPMPPWLDVGLRAVIAEAWPTAPSVAEVVA